MLDKPHSLETAFPKTVFINDHLFPKALFTTSMYEETQHFDRHDLANLAECHKEWFLTLFLSCLKLKFGHHVKAHNPL